MNAKRALVSSSRRSRNRRPSRRLSLLVRITLLAFIAGALGTACSSNEPTRTDSAATPAAPNAPRLDPSAVNDSPLVVLPHSTHPAVQQTRAGRGPCSARHICPLHAARAQAQPAAGGRARGAHRRAPRQDLARSITSGSTVERVRGPVRRRHRRTSPSSPAGSRRTGSTSTTCPRAGCSSSSRARRRR